MSDISADSSASPITVSEFFGSGDTRKSNVNLRVEIDTSPPFGSVKEAVSRFSSGGGKCSDGGSGVPWITLNKLSLEDHYHDLDEIDMKKVEEQTLELEKDLIVKELQTLDVLEELSTTKRIVEELKQQLQNEAVKSMAVSSYDKNVIHHPSVDLDKENHQYRAKNYPCAVGNSSPCPNSSPDLILMELKQAKLNLGKTIHDLGMIQSSVESLNRKIQNEKTSLEKTHGRLQVEHQVCVENSPCVVRDVPVMNYKPEQTKKVDEDFEVLRVEETKTCLKTAEMRWVAAKKMEEAAKAAEAVAFAEIKAFSGHEKSSSIFPLNPDKTIFPETHSPLVWKAHKGEKTVKKNVPDEANISKLAIMKKLEDAMKEVKLSKEALGKALTRVEVAIEKQITAEEALRMWMTDRDQRVTTLKNLNNYTGPTDHPLSSPQETTSQENPANDESRPVLRSTVSMRDVLSRKQVIPEEYAVRRQTEGQRVALSQMLSELRQDLSVPTKIDGNHQKQILAQRKKFGFIHIPIPSTKQNKRSVQPSDLR